MSHYIHQARILSLILVLLMLCFPCISFGADAPAKFEITVDANLRRVSVKVDNAGLREVLAQLSTKTGMIVEVLEGVPDTKVSVDMKDVPYFGISSLLEQIGAKNYGVGYERETGRQYVYVVNNSSELPELLKGKTVVKPGNFANGKGVNRVKGKNIVTETNEQKGYSVSYIKDEVLLKFHLGVT